MLGLLAIKASSMHVTISNDPFETPSHASDVHCTPSLLRSLVPMVGPRKIVLDSIVVIDLLLGLEVVEEDGALLGFFTPVPDDDARAVYDLACVALAIDLACILVSTMSMPHRYS